jgi:hypothetical protein
VIPFCTPVHMYMPKSAAVHAVILAQVAGKAGTWSDRPTWRVQQGRESEGGRDMSGQLLTLHRVWAVPWQLPQSNYYTRAAHQYHTWPGWKVHALTALSTPAIPKAAICQGQCTVAAAAAAAAAANMQIRCPDMCWSKSPGYPQHSCGPGHPTTLFQQG